jgi:signal transduction histidine kinase
VEGGLSRVPVLIFSSEGGRGLGLTLVKSLVEMHGGTVTARRRGKPGSITI